MRYVLTLIADPTASDLTAAVAETARQGLAAAGGEADAADWLERDVACDLPFDGVEPAAARASVAKALAGRGLDIGAQPTAGRRKALLVADMESTVIREEMLDELAARVGIGPEIAAITARSMAGEVNFEESLRQRVALLGGLSEALIDELAAVMTLSSGSRRLVATLKAAGVYCALVSGGFLCFTGRVRDLCGFDEDRANRLLIEDGRLTGKVGEPILGPAAKLEALRDLAQARGLALSQTCAVGDGANDLEMIAAAGLGAAYRGKPRVRAAADVSIDHGDLTALLYLQGYRRDEFVD